MRTPAQTISGDFFKRADSLDPAQFADMRPYLRTEACLMAREVGLSIPDIAARTGMTSADIGRILDQPHRHNPFAIAMLANYPEGGVL